MPQKVELRGVPAAPGLALGPLVQLDLGPCAAASQADGNPEIDLRAAIQAARGDLTRLCEAVDDEAAAILEFQVAMLEDEALSDPAFHMIAEGAGAKAAWETALAEQIDDYEAADDEYFRARAADLRDIRDRVLRHLLGATMGGFPPGAVLAGEDLTPSLFLEADWSQGGGIALTAGSDKSHVAMLARARGVPMVVGLRDAVLAGHGEAMVNGEAGVVVFSPDAGARRDFAAKSRAAAARRARAANYLHGPARTADGVAVRVMINVAGLDDLQAVEPDTCDGIGLMRTEFLFRDGAALPGEEAQYGIYRQLLEWADGRPVTVRSLDAGGDKPVAGLTLDGERNPFLGMRGLRLSLRRPEVFRVQLRALARAAVHGPLKVMWPMVTTPAEVVAAAALFDGVMEELRTEGLACAKPPLGIMVEVPTVAITPELFAAADFFSIGSNDLCQYLTAAARDNAAVAELAGPPPAFFKLLSGVCAHAASVGKEVSLCGDMAGEARHLQALLFCGLRVLSVVPPALAPTKAALADTLALAGTGASHVESGGHEGSVDGGR